MDPVNVFRTAMRQAGLDFAGPIHADGKLHRFNAEGDKGLASWFVLHADGRPAGKFGCFRRGFTEAWHLKSERTLSTSEWATIRRRWAEAEAARIKEEERLRELARVKAERIVRNSQPANPNHPYLARKKVKPHGDLRQWRDLLVLPLRDEAGVLHSLQYIAPDKRFGEGEDKRDKTYLKYGRTTGAFFTVSDNPTGPLVIAEGYATAASIAEATGFATIAAMNAGNLKPVAEALRRKFPDREIIIAADNDAATPGNPGLTKGTEAARVIGGRLAVPTFKDTSTHPTDFNDLQNLEGTDAVKHHIASASLASEYLPEESPIALMEIRAYTPPPLDLLPEELRDYVAKAAESLRVDNSYVFLPLLSALGAAIGDTRTIELKHGFTQPPMVWTGIIGKSGTKKSPAMQCGGQFMHDRERELVSINKFARQQYEREVAEWEYSSKDTRGPKPPKPTDQKILVDDLTIASIVPDLVENPRGLFVLKDELSHWFASFDQYAAKGKGADVARWLSLHTGVFIGVDRKTNRECHRVFNPRVAVCGGIQPKILRQCLTEEFFDRGLPARFLFACPPDQPDCWTDATVPESVINRAGAVFKRLFALEPDREESGARKPKAVHLDAHAKAVFVEFYNYAGRKAACGSDRDEAAWHKLSGYAARLALVGHLARDGGETITADTMRAATELAQWFGEEASRVYRLLAEPDESAGLRRLIDHIRTHGGETTVRDLITNFHPLKNNTDEAEHQLNQLAANSFGEWIPDPISPKGGRPTRRFRLHSPENKVSANLQNPEKLGKSGGIADADTPSQVQTVSGQVQDLEQESAKNQLRV